MVEKVVNLIKEKDITFPRLLLLHYKDLKLDDLELIIIIYILNSSLEFNPKKISEDLKITLQEVLMKIDSLSNKDILKIELKKINNIRQEFININSLYNKLSYFVVNEEIKGSGTLKSLYTNLKKHHFAFCNQCYLVNLAFVKGIDDGFLLINNEKIRIASSRKKSFMQELTAYIGEI